MSGAPVEGTSGVAMQALLVPDCGLLSLVVHRGCGLLHARDMGFPQGKDNTLIVLYIE
jgi:hypothetical protein